MGIPLVALQGQGPEIAKGLGDIVPNQLKLRAMLDEQAQRQQNFQLGQAKLTDWQQMQQKQAAIHQAIATNGGLEQALPDIEKIDPKFALDTRKGLAEWNKASTDEKISKLALHQKNAERAAQLAAGATDQPSWAAAVEQAHKEEVLPAEAYQALSKTPYSPDVVKSIQDQSLSAAQRINEQKEALAQQKAEEQAKQAAERERLAAMPEPDKLFQNHYDKLVEAGQVEKNAATWLSERQKWDAEQKANKKSASDSEGTWTFAEDEKGKPILFNNKTAATRPAPGIQKAGTEKIKQDYVVGIDKQGKQVMVPEGEADKHELTQTGKAPTTQVASALDARQFKTIADKHGDPNKPETMGIKELIDSLDKDGKLGVASSRMNDFLYGKVGTLPSDDPRIAALLNKADLAMTLSMKAHFGTSGGRSPAMLEHFLNMANAKKMDGPALKAGFNAVDDYMTDRAMLPNEQSAAPKVGDKKTFPNGRVGVWDGHGYTPEAK